MTRIADQTDPPENVEADPTPRKRGFTFPGAVTTLAIVTVVVWVAALLLPSGDYQRDEAGSPIPGTFQEVPSPLTFGEKVQQLILSPVNGLFGLAEPDTGFVSTETLGTMFGSIGVVFFIMSIGAFISVSFSTRSLEVAVGALATRLQDKSWLLIAAIMALFSVLGTTMGFSVETFGFYPLLIPLMMVLGYDRLVTAAMIILGALIGVMGATVNPFSIGVAADVADVPLGDGIGLRLVLWVLLTVLAIAFVLRYAARVRRDPGASLVGFEETDPDSGPAGSADHTLTGTQKWVLAITGLAFGLMIFSVIPWSSILGLDAGPAEDYYRHVTEAPDLWFELGWWFPELSMLFVLASVLVGLIARMGEKETVRLIGQGAADMINPAMVILLAQGVAVIMKNTQTLDTILYSMEQLVRGASAGLFAVINMLINMPLAVLIPSSSGHGALAMPLLAPLGDFAGVTRSLTITSWIMGHGLTLLWAPTSVVLVGGLAIAKVGYDKWLRFVWPLLLILFVVAAAGVALAAGLG